MSGLTQDIRYALRQFRNNPRFTVIAALTLALGIGASTAIFDVVNTVLLHPLPYRHPERLVLVTESLPAMSADEVGVSAQEYLDYRDRTRSFSQVASYESDGFNLIGQGRPLRVNAAAISASAFPLLAVSPELGHVFTDSDNRYGSPHVVLLSHSLYTAASETLWANQSNSTSRAIPSSGLCRHRSASPSMELLYRKWRICGYLRSSHRINLRRRIVLRNSESGWSA